MTLCDWSLSFSLKWSRTLTSTRAWWWKRFLFLIIFMATWLPERWSRALMTWPKEPLPITSRISYLYAMWSCICCGWCFGWLMWNTGYLKGFLKEKYLFSTKLFFVIQIFRTKWLQSFCTKFWDFWNILILFFIIKKLR